MTPSIPQAAATDDGFSTHGKLLFGLAFTAIFLVLAVQYHVEPLGGAVAGLIGAIVGVGFSAVLDRYREPLRRANDLLVIAAFLVPMLAVLFGMSYVASFEIVGYQAIGAICAVWAVTVYGLATDSA
ncbi:hypothetical protein [Salinarchaeum laminariae]|uniref:hypothetical protein n=1 Tax=Salinarchaeum laminariae TaxID=869888 RepID=UPI0020C03371|nr:hypothetical protein [Salinarchaeum laminariae]